MTDDVKCPYCKQCNEIDHEDGYGYEEDTYHEQECIHCEKIFHYQTTTSFYYDSYQAPCLNEGGDHDFKEVNYGIPEEYFKNRYKCKCCEKEVKIVPACETCKNVRESCLVEKSCRPDLGQFFFNNWQLDIKKLNRED